MTQLDALTRKFTDDEVQHFEGRGGKTMTYVEDESVMDRLDEALGFGNWSVDVDPIPVYEGVVKVRLGVLTEHGWVFYEDFGYPNHDGGEQLKEAVSDGIRRCGRMLGIARDLYRKPSNHKSPGVSSSTPAAPSTAAGRVPPRPAATTVPPEPDWMDAPSAVETARTARGATQAPDDEGTCPQHGKAWKENSRGFYCATKVGDGWCDEKPTQRWVSGRAAVGAAR